MSDTPRTDEFIVCAVRTDHNWRTFARQLERDIHELNERLIDRQNTLMAALVELQDAKRQIIYLTA